MDTLKRSSSRNAKCASQKNPAAKTQAAPDSRPPVCTFGLQLPNGGCIEIVKDPKTERLGLLVFAKSSCHIVAAVEADGRKFLPPEIDASVLRALMLPTQFGESESTRELFSEVQETFAINGFTKEVAPLAAYSIFSTWFPELLPAAPCLLLTGPRPEATLFLQLYGCMARHSLPLGDVTRAGLCSLPMELQLTLLIDAERMCRSSTQLLITSNNRDAFIPSNGRLVNIFAAKAVYLGNAASGCDFGDSTLRIHLQAFRRRFPTLSAEALEKIAAQIQPKMMAYRCRSMAKVRDSEFDLPRLDSELRILARVLGAPIIDAADLQADLGPILDNSQAALRAARWLDLRCVEIEALLALCHEENRKKIHAGEVARHAAAILKGRGETGKIVDKEVAGNLRSFGFILKRDSSGYGFRVTGQARRRIHELARNNDVAAVQAGVVKCVLCAEIFVAREAENQTASEPKEEEIEAPRQM